LGVTVETMSKRDATEVLLELFPRKVTMDVEDCGDVIIEIAAFWEFCGRVHHLESADEMAAHVRSLANAFEGEMNNPENFGMAKSIVSQGIGQGFDMSSEEGIAEFMAAFNDSLTLPDFDVASADHAPTVSQPRIDLPSDRKKRKQLLAKKKKSAKRKKR